MKLEKKCSIVYGCDSLEAEFENEFTDEEINFLKEIKFKKVKLTLEVEEPILDEAERKYLDGVIRPFRDEVEYIIKKKSYNFENKEYLVIHSSQNQTMPFPYFKKGLMYKNMELNKEYTLDDLNL